MDRIYRGKTKNGEWGYGSYLRTDSLYDGARGLHRDWIIESAGQSGGMVCLRKKFAVMPETVGQYIGLVDKNGKKIFEGDIVDIPGSKKLGLPAEIWFNQWTASFEIRRIGYNSLSVDGIEYWGEVVGNIHDNPELVGGDC